MLHIKYTSEDIIFTTREAQMDKHYPNELFEMCWLF